MTSVMPNLRRRRSKLVAKKAENLVLTMVGSESGRGERGEMRAAPGVLDTVAPGPSVYRFCLNFSTSRPERARCWGLGSGGLSRVMVCRRKR